MEINPIFRIPDYSIVASESALIRNTYDLIFWHGYTAMLVKLSIKIETIKGELYRAERMNTYELWD